MKARLQSRAHLDLPGLPSKDISKEAVETLRRVNF